MIHSLAYSFIGIQTLYLATYFPAVYWNTACLRVDSGLDKEASSNYDKIAKAVGNIMNRGIKLSLIDINKSQYMFEPDEENDRIIYGMKALNGVGGEIIDEILSNRPYESLKDFQSKVKANKTVMISLIKSGAFDSFGKREDIMAEYIWSICEPKKRITLQNFNGLMERGLIPPELDFQKKVFMFNKSLKKVKQDGYFILEDKRYDFYSKYFDLDKLEPICGTVSIREDVWKKIYKNRMEPARDYFKKNQDEILSQLNQTLFDEVWAKYAQGSLSRWEMDSLGMYYSGHELKNAAKHQYEIVSYKDLPKEPLIAYTFTRNGREIPIYETNRIIGTVIAKDDSHSNVSILTPDSGVVTVKFNRDYFAKYNRRISEEQIDGTKKVREPGWFQRGTLVMVSGVRNGDLFITKKYKKSTSHQLYKITCVHEDGSLEFTNKRWGEEPEE